MENKVYVNEIEYGRLCRLDGRMDALMSYINKIEKEDGAASYMEIDVVKAIIGMLND